MSVNTDQSVPQKIESQGREQKKENQIPGRGTKEEKKMEEQRKKMKYPSRGTDIYVNSTIVKHHILIKKRYNPTWW